MSRAYELLHELGRQDLPGGRRVTESSGHDDRGSEEVVLVADWLTNVQADPDTERLETNTVVLIDRSSELLV